ncbi:MAG: hypothetical protein JJV97_05340 [SAR324 cluster bacterium]|nr:hypothetical protein [SAR324 cluster bacterium]
MVDEATGYQYDRDKDELQITLKAYIDGEIAKWQLTFSQDFYRQISRLWRQSDNGSSNKRPMFFGRLTNKYIYQPMMDGIVLSGIKKLAKENNKNIKFHQYLTEDVGKQHLKEQITAV